MAAMRMTYRTDYALRVLIYLAMRPGHVCTVNDIAETYDLSRNHLIKVAQTLRDLGFVETSRGRSGGIRLALPPGDIPVGDLVRATEDDFSLVECMMAQGNNCRISPGCMLKGMFAEALAAYMAVLDRYTLADIVRNRAVLAGLLGLGEHPDAMSLEQAS
jgi:Rrf2 family nitric oxide-sensitive transcriptional repressor